MIYIKEANHNKIGGNKSLFLSFDYNQVIINIIKSLVSCYWDKKTKTWEVPVTCLGYLLDNLTYYDDITLLLDNSKEEEKPVKLVCNYKTKPLEHQIEGITYGLRHNNFLLLDSPGLGKTLQATYIAEELQQQEGIEHALVICGVNSLKLNWEKEINKHSRLSCRVLGKQITKNGKIRYAKVVDRARELMNPIKEFFVIINIESIRNKNIVDALIKGPNKFGLIIADEVHKMASWSSIQGDNFLKLDAPHKVAMTGTLITNSPLSSYLPLAWIGKESKRNVTRFKKTFCNFEGGDSKGRIIGYKNLSLLQEEIESCSLRRTKDILGDKLPSKTIIDEYLEMDEDQEKFYDSVRKGIKEECNKVELKTNNMLSLVTRLRQAISTPESLTTNKVSNCKLERAVELTKEIVSNGEKVVIFSTFKDPVYKLAEMLKEYNPLVATGDEDDGEVSKRVDMFQNDNEHQVFIATMQKLSTGQTLNRACYEINIDSAWTYALNLQANDRIHRIGSKKPVTIYYLWCNNTFDMKVKDIVNTKKDLGGYLIDDEVPEQVCDMLKQALIDEGIIG